MAITVNLRYTGRDGSALAFVREMEESGTADRIRAEDGNLRYEYYRSMADPETVLLIDSWRDQAAIDSHHASPMMVTVAALRERYDLHMTAERFMDADTPASEDVFIRRRSLGSARIRCGACARCAAVVRGRRAARRGEAAMQKTRCEHGI